MLEDRRVGRFSVSAEIINEAPDVMRQIMGYVIVIRAESMLYNNSIEYHAICEDFDVLTEGEMLPEYNVLCSQDDDTLTVTWQRVA